MAGPNRSPLDVPGDYLIPLPAIYFLSGMPALVYQTVWQRLLVLHSGVGTTSVAIIVAAYLLGLGLGSLLGAYFSRSYSPEKSLRLFAGLEVCIGIFAIASPKILYDFLYVQHGSLYGELWSACLLHFAVLIVPTVLMGATLPLMTRSLVRSTTTAARSIGLLYGLNTLGAAFGAILAPWLLMPYVGVVGALWTGAACNFAVALLASRANGPKTRQVVHRPAAMESTASRVVAQPAEQTAEDHSPAEELVRGASSPFAVWMLLYLLGGVCAIGLEIVWFRILDVAVKSTSFTFGTVLGTYLACMATGSIFGAFRADRLSDPFRSFLRIQCQILIVSGLLLLFLVESPATLPGVSWFVGYWAEENPLRPSRDQFWPSLNLYVLLPVFLMGLPTFLMGYSFSVLQRGVQNDVTKSGYRVGLLQAANIAGCTAGSLLSGLWLLDVLGSMDTIRLIVSIGVVFAFIGVFATKDRGGFLIYAGLTIAVCLLLPGNHDLWRRLHGQDHAKDALFAEDVTSVCALMAQKESRSWWMWANGKTQSLLPFGGFHSKLGILPVTLHPLPRSVAIIGLGSGNTAWAAGCRPDTESVRVFEICTPEIRLLQSRFATEKWPQVQQFLNDPRMQIDALDARYALMTEDTQYDVIEADAIRHHGAYAGYLYSIEFFQLCGRRLNPGGYMCTWSPTPLTHTTFRRAFPHVLDLEDGMLLIGSNDPIEPNPEVWESRIRSVEDYIQQTLVESCINSIKSAKLAPEAHPDDWVNTDLFPYDEFN